MSELLRVLITHDCNSHRIYETVCELHTAWHDWEAERKREGRENRPARTPEEEEENRHYMMMKLSDPLYRFQDPQASNAPHHIRVIVRE
jgi:metacaspase-1